MSKEDLRFATGLQKKIGMKTKANHKFTKEDIITIPNILSFFRLLLIPVIVVLYCHYEYYRASAAVVVLSGATDIMDGKIARRFHMVSDFGKILDPIADKLTQAAMVCCLLSRYSWMGALIILLVLKESFQLVCRYAVLKVTGEVNSAKWYGKMSTATVYTVMIILFLFPNMPQAAINAMTVLCGIVLTASMLLYGRFYYRILKTNGAFQAYSGTLTKVWKIILLIDWLVIIGLLCYYIKDFSVESILRYTPQNHVLSFFVILLLFVLKSISIVIYIGILYAASGILFSLPFALIVDILGTAAALSVPYLIGRVIGPNVAARIMERYPKVEAIRDKRRNGDFLFSFIIRFIGGLPTDIVSLLMGTMKVDYLRYLFGGLLGLAPRMAVYSIMGMSVTDMNFSLFFIAIAVELIIVAGTAIMTKRHSHRS